MCMWVQKYTQYSLYFDAHSSLIKVAKCPTKSEHEWTVYNCYNIRSYCLFVPFSLPNVCAYHKALYILSPRLKELDSYSLYLYGIEVEMKRKRILCNPSCSWHGKTTYKDWKYFTVPCEHYVQSNGLKICPPLCKHSLTTG